MSRNAELRVLVGCECSGTVRRAFANRGFDAWSCDLKPSEDGSNRHIRGDIRDYLDNDWEWLCADCLDQFFKEENTRPTQQGE